MRVALVSAAVIVVLIVTASAVYMVKDREQLLQETLIQQSVNLSQKKAIDDLKSQNSKIEQQVIERYAINRKQKTALHALQKRLDHELTKITKEEEECLRATMPTAIIEFLSGKTSSNSGYESD